MKSQNSRKNKVISVFCPERGKVASAFAGSLSFAFSRAKQRVLILDLDDKLTLSKILANERKDWTQVFGKQYPISNYISSTKDPFVDILASDKRRFSVWKSTLQDVFKNLVGGVTGEMLLKEKLEDEGITNFYDRIILVLPSKIDHAFVEGVMTTNTLIFLADLEDELLFAKSSTILGIINLVNQRYSREIVLQKVVPIIEKRIRKTKLTKNQLGLLSNFFEERVGKDQWEFTESSKWIKDTLFTSKKKQKKQAQIFRKLVESLV